MDIEFQEVAHNWRKINIEALRHANGIYYQLYTESSLYQRKCWLENPIVVKQEIMEFINVILQTFLKNEALFYPQHQEKKLGFDFEIWTYVDFGQEDYNELEKVQAQRTFNLNQNVVRLRDWLMVLKEICFGTENGQYKLSREIYYQNIDTVDSQAQIDKTIKEIAFFTRQPRHYLHLDASAKGLLSGNLQISINGSGEIFDINSMSELQGGFSIKNFYNIEFENQENCDFALIVEKDSVYNQLIQEGFFEIGNFPRGVLITGKGYPDYSTKLLVKKLFLKKPELIFFYLGDADPHGIDIFLNYLFSTAKQIYEDNSTPVIWPLGVNLLDFIQNGVTDRFEQLTSEDAAKIEEILERKYMNLEDQNKIQVLDNNNSLLYYQVMFGKLGYVLEMLRLMREYNFKAEIEAIEQLGLDYIDYIRKQIERMNYLY